MPYSLARLMAYPAALTAVAALVLAPGHADALEQGDYQAGLYTAPGQLFTVKSPLGPEAYLVDAFEQSAGAVTFLDDDGRLYGVICSKSYDVLAGADNDFETDAAILRNWFRNATFPHFFERRIPGAWIASEGPGEFAGEPAWIATLYLPQGSALTRKDPKTGERIRDDAWRGIVVFSRGEHTYLIMTDTPPAPGRNSFLVQLSEFYRGITFSPELPNPDLAIVGIKNAGT